MNSPNEPKAPCGELPAAACFIAQEEFKQVVHNVGELKKTLDRIETSIRGDEALGHRGIVARLNFTERILLALSACIAVLGGEKLVKLFF